MGAKFQCEFISSCINWSPLDEDRRCVRGGFCCFNECRDVCLFGAFHKFMLIIFVWLTVNKTTEVSDNILIGFLGASVLLFVIAKKQELLKV